MGAAAGEEDGRRGDRSRDRPPSAPHLPSPALGVEPDRPRGQRGGKCAHRVQRARWTQPPAVPQRDFPLDLLHAGGSGRANVPSSRGSAARLPVLRGEATRPSDSVERGSRPLSGRNRRTISRTRAPRRSPGMAHRGIGVLSSERSRSSRRGRRPFVRLGYGPQDRRSATGDRRRSARSRSAPARPRRGTAADASSGRTGAARSVGGGASRRMGSLLGRTEPTSGPGLVGRDERESSS
jgi:hypothetical protein